MRTTLQCALILSFFVFQSYHGQNIGVQIDAAGNIANFDKGTTLVADHSENSRNSLSVENKSNIDNFTVFPNPLGPSRRLNIKGYQIKNIKLYSILGKMMLNHDYDGESDVLLNLKQFNSGVYFLKINETTTLKLIIK